MARPGSTRCSLRAPSRAFEQHDETGHRLWPAGIDRGVLDPYYRIAEEMLRVEQIPVDEVPRTGLVFSLLMKNLGYSCDRARYAVRGCVGSGFCVTGCIFGAKQSLFMNYLPESEKAGASIVTDLEAESIRTLVNVRDVPLRGALQDLSYRYQVVCRNRVKGEEDRCFVARVVILAAGTVGTAALLLRSRPTLPFLSRQVGRNIAFNGGIKVCGLLP